MKRRLNQLVALVLCAALLAGLAACTGVQSTSRPTASALAPASMPFAGVELKYAVSDTGAVGSETLALISMVEQRTGIIITPVITPITPHGEVDKTLVMLQAGDELDILYGSHPNLKTFYRAGVLHPLNELALSAEYDMAAVFGENIDPMEDGRVYGLPAFRDIWVTLYNKKIFDDANVPYPSAEGWTWEKYIETAQQLTNPQEDVWGSLIIDYDISNYMLATQMGAEPYKEDGSANFDDPLYAQSIAFLGSLFDGSIQPNYLSYKTNYAWNAFLLNGNTGMHVNGGWFCSMLPDTTQYPRDWKVGILPMPYPEGYEPSTLVVNGAYAIPVTSTKKEAAFEAVRCIAENQYLLGHGRVPARVDLSEAELERFIQEVMLPVYAFDGITAEEIKACWFGSQQQLPEKISGPGDVAIGQIIIEESSKYYSGDTTLDECMAAIQRRANTAIEGEQEY